MSTSPYSSLFCILATFLITTPSWQEDTNSKTVWLHIYIPVVLALEYIRGSLHCLINQKPVLTYPHGTLAVLMSPKVKSSVLPEKPPISCYKILYYQTKLTYLIWLSTKQPQWHSYKLDFFQFLMSFQLSGT